MSFTRKTGPYVSRQRVRKPIGSRSTCTVWTARGARGPGGSTRRAPWGLLRRGGELGGRRVGREDRHDAAAATGRELHDAGRLGEEGVVAAHADAVAGLEARAALPDDDLAAGDDLAGEHLHAEALGVRVAAVAAGAESLLMSHWRPSSPRCGSAPDGAPSCACSPAWACT